MNRKQLDLTKDSIVKTMIRFSIPFVLSYLLQSLYGMVDLFVVGKFAGTYSLAGVNMGSQILDLITGVAFGLLTGGTVVISQYIGAKKMKQAQDTIGSIIGFVFVLAIGITVMMLLLTGFVLQVMQTPEESFMEARNYYIVCMAGTFFIFGYNTVSAILNGLGDSRTPLKFVAIAACMNIVLDFVLVGYFHMGAKGAALATVFAQGISFLFGSHYLFKTGSKYGIEWKEIRIRKNILFNFLKIGLPSSFQDSILSFSLVILIAVANSLGVNAAAAVGVCGKLNVIFILPCIAMNASLSIMVGQNTGAGKMDRVIKCCKVNFAITAVYSATILAVFWFFGAYLIRFFTNDIVTIELGASYLKGHCWDYLLVMPAAYCLGGLFSGTGHTGCVAVTNAISSIFSRIPLAIGLAKIMGFGAVGIGIAYPLSTMISVCVYGIFLKKGVWKKPVISDAI